MNKEVFVSNLLKRYPNSWTNNNLNILKEDYLRALDNEKTDFERLEDWLIKEWDKPFIPTPAELREVGNKKLYRGSKDIFVQPIVFDPRYNETQTNDAFPFGTTEEQIIKTYEKKFSHVGEWKIIGYVN